MRYITLNPSFPCGAAVARETVNFQVTSSNLVGGVGSDPAITSRALLPTKT